MQQGSFADFRLPPGRHRLSQEQVAENQRWRLLGAAGEVVAERGFLHTKAPDIARCAGVSRSTFYSHFDGLSNCLLAAYEMAADCVLELIADTCGHGGGRDSRLRAAVDAVLRFFTAEPSLACLFGSELAAGIPEVASARASLTERLSQLLVASDGDSKDGSVARPFGMERHLVAGALSLVSDRISEGEVEALPSLSAELAEVLANHCRAA
jgi:AcrR family transcriptional regulator